MRTQWRVPCHDGEVPIGVQDLGAGPDGDGPDEAIDQLAHGLARSE